MFKPLKADSGDGFLIAIFAGFVGGPLGLILSPIVLYVCTKKNRTKNKPFLYWFASGFILAPVCWVLFFLLYENAVSDHNDSRIVSRDVSSEVQLSCSKWNTKVFFENAKPTDVTRCLQSGSNIESQNNNNDFTPLHYAAGYSYDDDVIKLLLNAGANIEAKTKDGKTPLHMAVEFNDLRYVINTLIDAGADILAQDENGWTPLQYARKYGKSGIILISLNKTRKQQTTNTKVQGKGHTTPLHYAAESENPELVTRMIKAGADTEVRNRLGETPLHIAATQVKHNKSLGVLTALIQGGAYREARDNNNRTPLHRAAYYQCCNVQNSKTPEVVTILIQAGADTEARDKSGQTPLHIAVGDIRNLGVVTALIKGGANTEAQNNEGLTPLQTVIKYRSIRNRLEVLTALIKGGADLEVRDKFERTPLQLAAFTGRLELITPLIKGGANPKAEMKGEFAGLTLKDLIELYN